MGLKCEFLIIGDELLEGRLSDCNGPVFASWAFREGIKLERITFVSDQEDLLEAAIKEAWSRSDLILTSGGLGPTADDRTKKVLAKLLQKPLADSKEAREIVINHYARLKRDWTDSTNQYHLIPDSVTPLFNPEGLAPGLLFQTPTQSTLMFPGVPREFAAMLETHIMPEIKRLAPNLKRKTSLTIRTIGVAEETLFNKIAPNLWKDLETFGKLSSLPQTMGLDLVITPQKGEDFLDWSQEVRNFIEQSPLKKYLWQYGERSLGDFLIDLLSVKNQTVAFAESCTGGLVSSLITDLSGASRIFKGSVVCYDNEVKTELLKVDPETIREHGAVSEACVREMAKGVRQLLKTDFALSLSGIAGPTGGSKEKPVGTFALGWATSWGVGSELLYFHGERKQLKQRFALKALFKLRELVTDGPQV